MNILWTLIGSIEVLFASFCFAIWYFENETYANGLFKRITGGKSDIKLTDYVMDFESIRPTRLNIWPWQTNDLHKSPARRFQELALHHEMKYNSGTMKRSFYSCAPPLMACMRTGCDVCGKYDWGK